MKKELLLTLFSFAFLIVSNGQPYVKTNFGVKTTVSNFNIEVQFYNPSVVRIIKWPEDSFSTKQSLSVIETPQKTSLSINQRGDELLVKSRNLQVALNLTNGNISFTDLKSVPLLTEKEHSAVFTDFNDAGSKTYTVSQAFVLDKNEAIYGLGQQQQGKDGTTQPEIIHGAGKYR